MMIGCSLSLLAIVAGMFLLAKTQKDNLSNFFKYVAYFVIFAGFFHIVVGGAMFTMKRIFHCGTENCEMESKCHGKDTKNKKHKKNKHMSMSCDKMGSEKCAEGMQMEKCIMMKEGKCEEMTGGMGKADCCKDMKGKMVIKKDSVIIKK